MPEEQGYGAGGKQDRHDSIQQLSMLFYGQ